MKKIKKLVALLIVLGILTSLCGCTYVDTAINEDTETDRISTDDTETNSETVKMPSLMQELSVEDESFSIICEYNTGNYNIENWHITDNKHVSMKVKTKGLPDGYEVFIDHVHCDISLKTRNERTNGIKQDEMDDTFHGYSQDGFHIDNNSEYYNIFSIEGLNEKFFSMYINSYYGYGSETRIGESELINHGTYAEKLSVVYDISVKAPDSEYFCTKSVISEILIPVNQNGYNTTNVIKDFWTDEIVEE